MTCPKCKQNFTTKEFKVFHNNKHYLAKYCFTCRKKNAEKTKLYRSKNKEKMRILYNKYRDSNREKFKASRRLYMQKKCKDPIFKLRKNLRTRLWLILKKEWKSSKWISWLGCDFNFLKKHLESQFKDNMSWENFGQWHIDHIIPLNSAKNQEEVYKLCHYSNLQPLWAIENIKKGSKC